MDMNHLRVSKVVIARVNKMVHFLEHCGRKCGRKCTSYIDCAALERTTHQHSNNRNHRHRRFWASTPLFHRRFPLRNSCVMDGSGTWCLHAGTYADS